MSENITSAVPVHTQSIDDYTNIRTTVSDGRYYSVFVLLFLITACNAAFNLSYGWSQGVTIGACILMGLSYGLGDFIIISMAPSSLPRFIGQCMMALSLVGLIVLSVFSAGAFLISQQYQKENILIESKKAYVDQLNAGLATLDPKTRPGNYRETAKRLEIAQKELAELTKGKGSDGSAAIYYWLASSLGYSPESVSLTIRLTWAANFVFAGLALSFTLATLCCPATIAKQVAFQRRVEAAKDSDTEEQEQQSKEQRSRKPRAPTYDTGTHVGASNATRYERIREAVAAGELRPSVRSLKGEGIGTTTAEKYLKDLAADGVIYKNGQGYKISAAE